VNDEAIKVLADVLASKDEEDPELKFLDLDFDDIARGLLYALEDAGYRVVKQQKVERCLVFREGLGSALWEGEQRRAAEPMWRDLL
jgi:hypothetical protein